MRPFSLAHINKIILFRYSERRKSYLAIKLLFEIEKENGMYLETSFTLNDFVPRFKF